MITYNKKDKELHGKSYSQSKKFEDEDVTVYSNYDFSIVTVKSDNLKFEYTGAKDFGEKVEEIIKDYNIETPDKVSKNISNKLKKLLMSFIFKCFIEKPKEFTDYIDSLKIEFYNDGYSDAQKHIKEALGIL